MVCLRFEPRAAGWKAQTNPLSYGGTPAFLTQRQNAFMGKWEFQSSTLIYAMLDNEA